MGLSVKLCTADSGEQSGVSTKPQDLYRLNTQMITGSSRDFIKVVNLVFRIQICVPKSAFLDHSRLRCESMCKGICICMYSDW